MRAVEEFYLPTLFLSLSRFSIFISVKQTSGSILFVKHKHNCVCTRELSHTDRPTIYYTSLHYVEKLKKEIKYEKKISPKLWCIWNKKVEIRSKVNKQLSVKNHHQYRHFPFHCRRVLSKSWTKSFLKFVSNRKTVESSKL